MSVMRIFVSHSHADNDFTFELYRALDKAGADVWWDSAKLGQGRIRETIDREMRSRKVFIVVLSPAALESKWVIREINAALDLQDDDDSRVILPIVAETITPSMIPAFLLSIFRIEGHNATALPHEESIRKTLTRLGLEFDQAALSSYRQEVGQAILHCYRQHGCIAGGLRLYQPISKEQGAPLVSRRGTQGYEMPFEKGSIFWTEASGAHPVWWEIYDCFKRLDGVNGRLGFPVTDELVIPENPDFKTKGVCQRFEFEWDYPPDIIERANGTAYGAMVYWCAPDHCHPVWGGIGEGYERNGGVSGYLGFPTSDEMVAAPSPAGTTGWYQKFQGGTIYWCSKCEKRGGNPVHGAIEAMFHQLGGTGSPLGFPLTGEMTAANSPQGSSGVFQRFEGEWNYPADVRRLPDIPYGASIYWCETYGAQPVWAGIGEFHERQFGTAGSLGFPTAPPVSAISPSGAEGSYQTFEGGIIAWHPEYNTILVSGSILTLYMACGGCSGKYGFPTAAETVLTAGWRAQEFEGGLIGVPSDDLSPHP